MLLCTPLPPRRLESWIIRGVGTTSWFLLPISTYAVACQPVSLELRCYMVPIGGGWDFAYGGEDTPVLGSEVAQVLGIELHDGRHTKERDAENI